MFTGIIQAKGECVTLQFPKIQLKAPLLFANKQPGTSICVDGICLTLIKEPQRQKGEDSVLLLFDVIEQTRALSSANSWEVGSLLNLEASLKFGDEVAGHLVSGHVHCVGKVVSTKMHDTQFVVKIKVHSEYSQYVFDQGFIAVNGVSLTVANIQQDMFEVCLIPETCNRTNLAHLACGNLVNLEFEQNTVSVVKTVNRVLKAK